MYLPIFYQDPYDQTPLLEESKGLRNPRTGYLYPVRDGVPVFLPPGSVAGPNARYQKLYDRMALPYDLATRLYAWLKTGSERKRRMAYLDLLETYDEAAVLEVSVGTGSNWRYLNRRLHFYGLDLSAGMLAQCRRRAYHMKLRARLCQGLAEHLPYPNSAFDCVFHTGGINFFTDQAAALREMVRVARPGSRLIVVDETEMAAQLHEDQMFAKAFFKDRPRKIEPPVKLLPAGMQEVSVKGIWDDELYVLSFRKPRG